MGKLPLSVTFLTYSKVFPKLVNFIALPAYMIWNLTTSFDREKLLDSAIRYGKSPYGEHLKAVAEGRVKY